MRRVALIVICCASFQLFVSAPAQAWWGWLDQLSGPGPFKGIQFEYRVACFGGQPGTGAPKEESKDAEKKPPLIGFESSCPTYDQEGHKAPVSVSVGVRFFHAHGDSQYAEGKTIGLVTLEPAFSWSVIRNPHHDYFDVGVAGGMYWLSSEGFRSINGMVLEPIRLDVHLPTLMPFEGDNVRTPSNWLLVLAHTVVVRFSATVFPGGFEGNALRGIGDKSRRIPGEGRFSGAIFVDLQPVLRKITYQ